MSAEWVIIRGSGVAAFALLSASVIWGLLVSSKLVARFVKAKPLTWFHESLGIGALLATIVHVFVISIHDFLDFTWAEILVPGSSDWSPLPIAFGTLAMYGLAVIVISFYVRKWIGQQRWRAVHFASFGVFLASLFHGIQAGTDTSNPMVLGLYAGATVVVFALLAHRLIPLVPGSQTSPPAPGDNPIRAGTSPRTAPDADRSRSGRAGVESRVPPRDR